MTTSSEADRKKKLRKKKEERKRRTPERASCKIDEETIGAARITHENHLQRDLILAIIIENEKYSKLKSQTKRHCRKNKLKREK